MYADIFWSMIFAMIFSACFRKNETVIIRVEEEEPYYDPNIDPWIYFEK